MFTSRDRADAELFAVFGDGAAGNGVAARGEDLGKLFIGKGMLFVFRRDELFQEVFGETGGCEKGAEGEKATRSSDIFARKSAGEGRLVEVEGLGSFRKGQRAEGDILF